MKTWKIDSFRGDNFFMSNMYPCKIKLGPVTYDCAEAAFQAVKLVDKSQRKMFAGLNGQQAKALGRKVQLRPDWDNIKVDVMRWVITEKFNQNPDIRMRLYRCAYRNELIEGNTWGDTYWGVCNGVGENWLGRILMEYAEKTPSELETMEKTDAVPEPVARFKCRLQAESNDAGYDMYDCQYYRCPQFYAVETWDKNPIGKVSHDVYFITADGKEFALVFRETL